MTEPEKQTNQRRALAGVDIGGTNTKYGAITESGIVLFARARPTNIAGAPKRLLDDLISILEELVTSVTNLNYQLNSIGVGSPGVINPTTGAVLSGSHNIPGWAGTELGAALTETLKLPIVVDNDANAMGLAEMTLGAGRGAKSALFVTVGTGIGGAIVRDGKIWRGPDFKAGEFFDTPLNSGETLEEATNSKALLSKFTELGGSTSATISDLAKAWESNDSAARDTVAQIGQTLGRALCGIRQSLDDQFDDKLDNQTESRITKIIVGGGVIEALPGLVVEIKKSIIEQSPELEILAAELGNQAGFIGAALLTQNGITLTGGE